MSSFITQSKEPLQSMALALEDPNKGFINFNACSVFLTFPITINQQDLGICGQ